ncbi:MAG: hypothetical protein ACK559_20475, partial [bacterium]
LPRPIKARRLDEKAVKTSLQGPFVLKLFDSPQFKLLEERFVGPRQLAQIGAVTLTDKDLSGQRQAAAGQGESPSISGEREASVGRIAVDNLELPAIDRGCPDRFPSAILGDEQDAPTVRRPEQITDIAVKS